MAYMKHAKDTVEGGGVERKRAQVTIFTTVGKKGVRQLATTVEHPSARTHTHASAGVSKSKQSLPPLRQSTRLDARLAFLTQRKETND